MALEIVNDPWADVDWDAVEHHRTESHWHPEPQKEPGPPHEGIDAHHDWGYTGLSLNMRTGNTQQYPWTDLEEIGNELGEDWEDRDPDALDMVPMLVCEDTVIDDYGEHVQGYFKNVEDIEGVDNSSTWATLDGMHELGAITWMAHPGRYYHPVEWPEEQREVPEHWIRLFNEYGENELVGLEAFNKQSVAPRDGSIIHIFSMELEDRRDCQLWDKCLAVHAPDRTIWGYSADDDNNPLERGEFNDCRAQIMLAEPSEVTEHGFWELWKDGICYPVERRGWDDAERDSPDWPKITSWNVDESNQEITIGGENFDHVAWVSHGAIVAKGNTIDLQDAPVGDYVRAMIRTDAAGEFVSTTQDDGSYQSMASSQPVYLDNSDNPWDGWSLESGANWRLESDSQWRMNITHTLKGDDE